MIQATVKDVQYGGREFTVELNDMRRIQVMLRDRGKAVVTGNGTLDLEDSPNLKTRTPTIRYGLRLWVKTLPDGRTIWASRGALRTVAKK